MVLAASVAGVLIYLPPANDTRNDSAANQGGATTTTPVDDGRPGDGQGPSTTGPAQAGLTAAKAANFVRDHYRSVGADPRKAWENLAPDYRPPIEQYQAFWGQWEKVTGNLVDVVTAENGFVVDIEVQFTEKGATSTETYRVGVQEFDGKPKIISSAKL